MKNNVKIIGDNNALVQGAKKSKININSNNKYINNKGTIIGIILTVLGLIITIIIGWDNILKFFN